MGGQINVANGLNQFTPARGVAFAYDARGNMSSDGVNAYGYDILNRLTSRGSATLGYDPAGRLYQSVAAGVTTRMLYDGAAMIGEYNSSNALQRRFVHGPGVDEPLVWYEGAGTSDRRWLLADERGSIVAVTNAAGAATNINTYDEYGVPGAGNVGRFQYTGQMWLSEVGVYHYKARAYAPALGRFLQTDPIGTAGGVNLYAYVGGDPVNFTDPWGLEEIPCGVGCTEETEPFTVTCNRACRLRLRREADARRAALARARAVIALVRGARAGGAPPPDIIQILLPIVQELVRCPVVKGDLGVGFQLGAGVGTPVAGASFRGNAGSRHITGSLYNGVRTYDSFGALGSVHLGLGRDTPFSLGGSAGIRTEGPAGPGLSTPNIANMTSSSAESTGFLGIDIGVAIGVNVDVRIGYDLPGIDEPCPS